MGRGKDRKRPRKKPRKRLRGRERRLEKAPGYVARQRGKPKNILRRYRRYFGVDYECAIFELQQLDVRFDPDYLARLREHLARRSRGEKKHEPIDRLEFDAHHGIEPTSDEFYAYIAGYTSGGAAYGVTWEEWERLAAEREDRERGPAARDERQGP